MTAAVHQQQRHVGGPPPVPPGRDWWPFFDAHRDLAMPPQLRDWTCAACSLDWVGRATNLDPDSSREAVVGELGYPACINEEYGLMSAGCAERYMEDVWSVVAVTEWVGWERAVELCATTTGLINSTKWGTYGHFAGIRGIGSGGDSLWIANSALGYGGIYEDVSRAQFEARAGTWKITYIVRE